ncbi:class I lanthipeptide [Haliangium ochraceum]|uniref:Uncharacterized protein n=1 Tax=Haliangium ochraceum (strain DSM 14365 / JCM 11303 / SMP-2) TaxID=502025 RepID=D0LX29_HALO1|nr:hypothetical protein Hoch_3569 [Haliangium ochraceum DSM 14365]
MKRLSSLRTNAPARKRLSLNRETLRRLDEKQLKQVAGASDHWTCDLTTVTRVQEPAQ